MDRICCLAYLLHQSDDEKVKNLAVQLLNGDVSLKDIKRIKELKTKNIYLNNGSKAQTGCDPHEVAQFVEKFMIMA